MKKLLAAFLLFFSLPAAADWAEGSTFGVRTDNTKTPTAVFLNSYTGVGVPSGQWQTIDVSTLGIPADAKAVFLSGILIITHGSVTQTCDLQVSLRGYGDNLAANNYIGQAVETHIGGGQRSTMSAFVPVIDGKFQFLWTRSTFGQWPGECAYGVNLSAQGYVK